MKLASTSCVPVFLSLGVLVLAPACSDDGEVTTDPSTETSASGDGDGDPATASGDGDGDTTGDGDGDTTGDGDGDTTNSGDGDGDAFPGELPETYCPGPDCPEVPDAPLRAGTAVLDLVPSCFESWIDVAQNAEFDEGEDDFLDCGCDRLCPMDEGYVAPDEGENDGEFQAIYLAGFQNNRPASGVRGAELGLPGVGEGDGIWCSTVVLEQGNTRVALVSIDTVGYFYDEVLAIRELVADQDIDWLMVSATHNHEAPDTMGLWGVDIFAGGFDEDYRAQVRMTIAQSIVDAVADLEDVGSITVGRGSAYDANADDPAQGITNIHYDTRDPFIVDDAIDVLNLSNAQGDSIVTLVNYGNHPEAVSDENSLITSDYVHAVRRTISQGSSWETTDGVAGIGGDVIFIGGAVGGLMTPLRIQTTTPDGDTWSSGQFEKADAIGQLVGEIALDALANGESVDNPRLEFATQSFLSEVVNDSFKLLFMAGIFARETVEMDGKEYISTEMGILELGPIRMLTVPGELFPEIAVGGYDGSMMFTDNADFIDPDNPNPPDLDAAPEGPFLKERMGSPYTWILGLGNDELGYIVPAYDFELGNPPWLSEAEGDHYEETNSLGPQLEGQMFSIGQPLIDFIDWL